MKPISPKALGILILAATLGMSQVQARSISDIRATKSIVIGISANIPPFQFKVGGATVGYEIDLAKVMAQNMGVEIIFKEYPVVNDLLKAVAADQVDAAIGTFAITSTRATSYDFTLAYACPGASIITTDPNIKNQFDLKDKRIGLVRNTSFMSYVQKLPFEKQIIEYSTVEEQVQAYMQKKYDASIGWKAMTPFLGRVLNLNFQETPVLWSIPVGLIVKDGNVGLKLALNSAIYKAMRTGTLNTLDGRYFSNESVLCKK